MGDHPSGTGLYAAIVTALYRREKTGKGGIAQSSLLQNGLWANACFVQSRLFGEHVPLRAPRAQAPNPLANHYRCRDGRWFLMALFNEQRQLPGFLAAIGCTHLADDPRFATPAARKENARAMVAILDEVFAQRDLPEWRDDPARRRRDVRGDAHGRRGLQRCAVPADRRARALRRRQGPDDRRARFHLDGETKVAPRRAPSVGQHTEEVLREAGYSDGDIERLRALGVLG